MSEVMLDIKQWGNNLGVRLPAIIAKEAHLHAHQRVTLSVSRGNIIITPIIEKKQTLEEKLALYKPHLHGGEVMTSPEYLGAEKW